MAAHKKDSLSRDKEGRFKRFIGWKVGNGKTAMQHLFRLGRDEEEAKRRNGRLEQLWECVESRWKQLHREGKTADPCPLWDDVTLQIGGSIARGETACTLQPPAGLERCEPGVCATWLAVLQSHFPIIPLRLPEATMKAGIESLRHEEKVWEESKQITRRLLSNLGEPATTETLHQALDAYAAYIGEKYQGKPSNRPQQTSIRLLKRHAADCTLDKLTADKIETWLAYWCNRPATNGERLAFTTVRNALIVLRQFCRWLNRSEAFDWSMPARFDFPRCKIGRTQEDRAKKKVRPFYRLSELKVLWQYAKPWERALILLALNCGFSKKEIATLRKDEVVKGKAHTFIKRERIKTDVYAEWVLWPETLAALKYLEQYQRKDNPLVVLNTAGGALDRPTPKGNDNQCVKNHWDNLWKRITAKDHPAFHRLPFKHLRKTGAKLIRHLPIENAAEIASMYLAHCEQADSNDTLLPVYATRPWKKLHKALLRLRRKLLPIFASVDNPWDYKRFVTTPGQIAKIRELRAGGMKYRDIAAQVGLHHITVGKICREPTN